LNPLSSKKIIFPSTTRLWPKKYEIHNPNNTMAMEQGTEANNRGEILGQAT
jgi:hypothetical protein